MAPATGTGTDEERGSTEEDSGSLRLWQLHHLLIAQAIGDYGYAQGPVRAAINGERVLLRVSKCVRQPVSRTAMARPKCSAKR